MPGMSAIRTGVAILACAPAILPAQNVAPAIIQHSACYAAEIPFRFPSPFFLSLERGTHFLERGHYLVYPVLGRLERERSQHQGAFWLPLSTPDSVRIVWSNGHSGVRIDALRDGTSLRGTATVLRDYAALGHDGPPLPPPPSRDVRLTVTSCPARLRSDTLRD